MQGALSHFKTVNAVSQEEISFGVDFVKSYFPWPARFLDLNAKDYFAWGPVKPKNFESHFQTTEFLKSTV